MKVVIYGKMKCKFCAYAKDLCINEKLEFDYVDIGEDMEARQFVVEDLKAKTVPQIFVDGKHVGGYDDFFSYMNGGE